jgi:hypothetical protein
VAALAMILAARRRPQGVDALLIAIPVSALVSYYLFIHDMCVLLIPIVLTLDRLIGTGGIKYRQGRMQMETAALLFAAPACMPFIPANRFWAAPVPLLAFTFVVWINPSQVRDTPSPGEP